MDLQKLTIGQMAELNHISEQTLRLYDRVGLLKPRYIDRATGYRYYHITQSARLDMIQNMKVYGMTLRRIREFLEENDADALQKLLLEQADLAARALKALGFGQGDQIPVFLRSVPEFVYLLLGAEKIGASLLCRDNTLRENVDAVRLSGAKAMFAHDFLTKQAGRLSQRQQRGKGDSGESHWLLRAGSDAGSYP